MDLVTCCNNQHFFNNAKKLCSSFTNFYPTSKIFLCVFGELENLTDFDTGIINCRVIKIPKDCEHAWNPRFYYFKTAALKIGIDKCKDFFIWLDSCNRVVDRLYEVEEALNINTRFFDQYPNTEFYKIKNYTTAKCVEKLGLTQEQIKEWYGYQALIQAYKKTDENLKFINTMLEYMKDPEIAGPSNYLEKPDGPDSCVRHHRNDLSVLSLCIPKFGYDQPYDKDRSRKYGDKMTYETFGGDHGSNWEPRILTRQ